MKILVSEKLSEHKYKTPEGYLICTDAILARTGKQTYTKDEVFGDGDNTEIDIDRPYDQVMNEKTIASFENKPVTFDHPEEDVNVGNYKSYAVGYVRDVHQGKADGKDVILGNLVITDQDAINAIESGEHTDLSCGYDCDIKDDGNGGYAQNNIRGNHVALCKEGRAGMARIIDSKVEDSVNDSDELVVGKWYEFAKKIEVARNQYATSLRISGKSGNVYRYTIYLKNGEMYGSGTYSEIKKRFNIKDSKVDSKVEDNYMGVLPKERRYRYRGWVIIDRGYSSAPYSIEDYPYAKEFRTLEEAKAFIRKELSDSKEMTMSDAIKMLNIVDAYKKAKHR